MSFGKNTNGLRKKIAKKKIVFNEVVNGLDFIVSDIFLQGFKNVWLWIFLFALCPFSGFLKKLMCSKNHHQMTVKHFRVEISFCCHGNTLTMLEYTFCVYSNSSLLVTFLNASVLDRNRENFKQIKWDSCLTMKRSPSRPSKTCNAILGIASGIHITSGLAVIIFQVNSLVV